MTRVLVYTSFLELNANTVFWEKCFSKDVKGGWGGEYSYIFVGQRTYLCYFKKGMLELILSKVNKH